MRGFARGLVATGSTLLACIAAAVIAPPMAEAQAAECRDVSVPVEIVGHGELSMHGVLCDPKSTSLHAVQVLVPGATYNQSYWNFPHQPETYSFRLAMNRAGFTTLTLDRLGTGSSSRPPSAALTVSAQADAVHQVVQALRNGRVSGEAFRKVILGGHSLGSFIANAEAATYHDVDAVLLTGISHHLNLVGVSKVFATSMRPAALDPEIGGRGYDPGYLTTTPGSRDDSFYAPGTAEPGVAETDEATKDVVATPEVPDAVRSIVLPGSRTIDVPVMLANGAHDYLVCGTGTDCSDAESLEEDEAPYFSPAAKLHTYSLPDFGHSINLAPNTADYQRAVIDWAIPIAQRS